MNTKTTESKVAVARIVADCPKCQTQCEIDDFKNHNFKKEGEHCCMRCGESFRFEV